MSTAIVWIGFGIGLNIRFFMEFGRLPAGGGELLNWLLGLT